MTDNMFENIGNNKAVIIYLVIYSVLCCQVEHNRLVGNHHLTAAARTNLHIEIVGTVEIEAKTGS